MAADSLHELFRQRRLWKGSREGAAGAERGIATGFPSLDRILPYRGWPRGAVMEVAVSDWGIGELSLFLPLMVHYHQLGHYVTWIAPPHAPYPPALASNGLNMGLCRVLSNPGFGKEADRQIPWCAEKLLHNRACGLILAWPRTLSGGAVRRLQLAAEGGEALCILWRKVNRQRDWDGGPAALRLRLSRETRGLKLEIIKARGTCRYTETVLDI
ncbi:MAG: translesion DNA synthesis-associated protein ImuA [Arenicellales bacterium]